ncbi:MAG TPA: threonine/serine dehydratase [Candidatus Acidoferrales bacterium]|jgi:threonine dehydratase|nr:threonine/serine dehydratase [Candidatus Acidoferrales bacterium]
MTASVAGIRPANMVSRVEIQDAARRIALHIRRTPCIALDDNGFGVNARIFLKLEALQHTGSFKPRGAFNCILSSEVPEAGVIAASGGNHGAAVAYAAHQLGHHAEIFVPTISSPVKVERLRQYGATVNVGGRDYAEALAASQKRAAETGSLKVHAYDDPRVLAGQGTLGMEFEEQVRGLESVLIAVGGGGLIGGVAAWYQERVRVIGVEPERAPSLFKALEAGHVVEVETGGVAADSLGARRVGELMFPIAQRFVQRVVLVSDEQIIEAQRLLWQRLRIIAEPGGATALAALISGAYQPHPGERVGVVICGANADLSSFGA